MAGDDVLVVEGDVVNVGNDHNCFGCGRLNAHGLHLEFRMNPTGDGVWARFLPSVRFEGYEGVIHGGIVATLLDEVMAWSLYRDDIWAVTGQMSVRFRKPMMVGETILAIGHIGTRRGRVIEMSGELRREADDQLLAEATASFVKVSEAQAVVWREQYEREHGAQDAVERQ
ncbi:MAG: PaaI family thioesterase [Thermomicrobiales bacterium]